MHSSEIRAGREYWVTFIGSTIRVRTRRPMLDKPGDWVCSAGEAAAWCIIPASDFLRTVESA
jgi:hypothetical protein